MFYLTQSFLNISSEKMEKSVPLEFIHFPHFFSHLVAGNSQIYFYLILKVCPLPKGWTVLLHIFCPLSEVTGWMLRSSSSVHSSGVTVAEQRGLEQAFHYCAQNS